MRSQVSKSYRFIFRDSIGHPFHGVGHFRSSVRRETFELNVATNSAAMSRFNIESLKNSIAISISTLSLYRGLSYVPYEVSL